MPRKTDPSKIKTGAGLAPSDSIEGNAFVGTSITGAESNTLGAHINDPSDAHDASAVSIDGKPTGIFSTNNVEGALDELSGLVPPRPPTVGNKKTYMTFSGVPDWGVLKLADSGLTERGILTALGNLDSAIYPYFHEQPKEAWINEPNPRGADIRSDDTFNVLDAVYVGGGFGKTFSGGFNRASTSIVESFNLYQTTGGAREVVISGSLFPADRGTLAIFHLPSGGTLNDLECLAAIKCGQGVQDECDGAEGSLFTLAANDDIYEYPSAATGQYDLQELHTGYVRGKSYAISSVTDTPPHTQIATTATHGLVVGDQIYVNGCDAVPDINGYHTVVGIVSPTAITVASVGAITVAPTTGTFGLPLTPTDFDPSNAKNTAGQVNLGYTILGGTTVSAAPTSGSFVDGRDDNNFFRYRLPYLEKYDELIYTPASQQSRYFEKPPVSKDPSVNLVNAGNYDGFTKDYWTFQVARYRHKIELPAALSSKERGSVLMIHFKREATFEDLLNNNAAPLNEEVHSANLLDWTNFESVSNIFKTSTNNAYQSSDAYHILKSRIFEDDSGLDVPVISGSYTLNRTIDNVIFISGVAYFKAHPSAVTPLQLESVSFTVNDLFKHTFRTGRSSDVNEVTPALHTPDPMFLWMGSFGSKLSVPSEDHGRGDNSRKSEIKYSLLGAFDLSNPPAAAAVGTFNAPAVSHYVVQGDNVTPRFCADTKLRAFSRRPLLHDALTYTNGIALSETIGDTIMSHSTDGSLYSDSIVFTPQKDYEERFLDESYRWIGDLGASGGGYPAHLSVAEYDRIIGSGLSSTGVIDIPVRVSDVALTPSYTNASFVIQNRHEVALDTTPLSTDYEEAQVCGFPDRDPPLSDGITDPMPSNGLLKYPVDNYNVGHRPSVARGDLSSYAQPDYSGFIKDRVFIRAFDLAFSRSTVPVTEAIGSSFFKLRIHGLQLSDFAWSGGVGSGSDAIAIFVKLAGLTTWMDIGRLDGSGASKQDAFSDGAGCQVNDPVHTKNGVTQATGIVYADVLIHTGTSASIYENAQGEAPVLVKVVLKDSPAAKALNLEQGGSYSSSSGIRGLIGIEVLRPE